MTINLFGRNAIFGLGDEEIDEDVELANTIQRLGCGQLRNVPLLFSFGDPYIAEHGVESRYFCQQFCQHEVPVSCVFHSSPKSQSAHEPTENKEVSRKYFTHGT